MFETTEVILQMIQIYLAVGFSLGVLYNIFRFIRLTFPNLFLFGAVLDIIFTLTAGIVMFIFSAAYGMGYFRLYYVLAAALGFAANMFTLGFAVPPIARLTRRILRRLYSFITDVSCKMFSFIRQKTTNVFIKISEIIAYFNEKCKIHLKKHDNMLYNNYDHKIGLFIKKGGETGDVIKAKVRKIG
jgi:hypothetical protein